SLPILSDIAPVVSATYGVPFQFGGGNRPAQFVVDRKGILRYVYLAGMKPGHVFFSTEPDHGSHWSYDRLSPDELFRVIDGLDSRAAEQEGKLAALRKADVATLVESLKDREAFVRAEAASILAEMRAKADAAVPALIAALADPIGFVRSDAAKRLGKIGPKAKPAVPALVNLLKDPDEGVRWTAAHALGDIGSEAKAAVPALLRLEGDPFFEVRGMAPYAIGLIGPA